MPENNPAEGLSYEQAFEELVTIISTLESNQQSLEETMKLFERGQTLAQHCARLLDQAELKIRKIIAEEDTQTEGEG